MNTATPALQLTISPGTVYITTNPGQSSFANLVVTVANTGTDAVMLTAIWVQLPSNLYLAGSLSSINPNQPELWNFEAQPTAGVFEATPVNGAAVQLASNENFTFALNNVTLAQQTGTANVTIVAAIQNEASITQTPAINMELATAAIVVFNATPSDINPGDTSTLTWQTTGIDYCIVSPVGTQQQPATGTLQVNPNATIDYTLYAYAQGIILSAQWEILVENPAIINFGGVDGQTNVNYGESIELVWTCNQFVQSVKITSDNININIPDNLPLNGNVTLGPIEQDTNFLLTAYGSSQSVFATADAPINVNPPTAIFTASPDTNVWEQDAVTISWQITNAAAVSISPALPNGPSLQNLVGSVVINPTADVDYTLTVTGAPGTTTLTPNISFSVTTVRIAFSASPNPIIPFDDSNQTTLSWTAQAQVVTIDNKGVAVEGEQFITTPPNGTTYTLTAGTIQNPTLETLEVVIVNSYGPFQFNQFAPIDDMTGFTITNPIGLENLENSQYYAVVLTGVETVNGNLLLGYTNYSSPQDPPTFIVNVSPLQVQWTNPAQQIGTLIITND